MLQAKQQMEQIPTRRAEGHREGQAEIQGFRQKPYGRL